MNFHITVYTFKHLGKSVKLEKKIDEGYFTHSFNDLMHYCPYHFNLNAERTNDIFELCETQKCQKQYLWHCEKDMHQLLGSDVAYRASEALQKLYKLGFKLGNPSHKNPNWSYGIDMNHYDRVCVFAHHLYEFKKIGIKYPSGIFIINNKIEYVCIRNEKIPIICEDDEEDECDKTIEYEESEEESNEINNDKMITYFSHPSKGLFCVNSFRTAMEVYGILLCQNDSSAELWFFLALKMPDCPVVLKNCYNY